jgi:peptidoglycan/LPS O-acetylase OafA/YrhL
VRGFPGYVAVTAALAAVALAALSSGFDAASRRGIWLSVLVGLPVQWLLFGLLLRFRSAPSGFLAAWLGGMLGRFVLLGGMVAAVLMRDDLPPAPTLLALAILLFVMLLLEPLFLRNTGPLSGTK